MADAGCDSDSPPLAHKQGVAVDADVDAHDNPPSTSHGQEDWGAYRQFHQRQNAG